MPPRSSPRANARASHAAVPSMQLNSSIARGIQMPLQQVTGVPGVMQQPSMGMPASGAMPSTMGMPAARMSTNMLSPRSSGMLGPSGVVGLSLGGSVPQMAYRAPVLSPRAGGAVPGYAHPTLQPQGAPHLPQQQAASSTQLAGSQLTGAHLGNSSGQIPLQLMTSTGHLGPQQVNQINAGHPSLGLPNVSAPHAAMGLPNASAPAGQLSPSSLLSGQLPTTLPIGSAHIPIQQQRQ